MTELIQCEYPYIIIVLRENKMKEKHKLMLSKKVNHKKKSISKQNY